MREPRLFDEFERVYERWRRGEVTQGQAADLLGRSVRTFRAMSAAMRLPAWRG
ncbi:MAG: hypothetical protein OXQ94_17010 [Gemmatimonadota bacterium]|nr:hypothetical protein [Gemmatimonadota bacterium]